MGVTYDYANIAKREWFPIDALGGNPKRHGLGRNLAARAFDLLPVAGEPTPTSNAVASGRWPSDSVAVIGDSHQNWLVCLEEFADIEADVILMVHENDGFEKIAAAAETDTSLFMELCHLLLTQQGPELEGDMKRHFGAIFP